MQVEKSFRASGKFFGYYKKKINPRLNAGDFFFAFKVNNLNR